MNEQRAHDVELNQLHDDVLHHINSQTDEIIHAFESIDSDESNPGSPVNVFNCDWYHEHSESSPDDDTDHDTDTEDGVEEHYGLIQSNMNLIAFVARQCETIARLRFCILRLRTHISELTSLIKNTRGDTKNAPPIDTIDECARVLVETNKDVAFLVAPNRNQVVTTEHLYSPIIKSQIKMQLDKIKTSKANSQEELWMYFDSGASRSVISPHSPKRSQLQAVTPAYGSCSIGDGTLLQYIEKGNVKDNLEITVVKDLKYDLFSSVNAAKQGLTSIIDFDLQTGQNNSYTIDKTTGIITPLVERGKDILELPLHLMLPPSACFTVIPAKSSTQDALPPHVVSMFWHCYDDVSFDPTNGDNNKTEYSLFTFDIIKSLSERERDFLYPCSTRTLTPEKDPADDKKRDHWH
jgi:hypothetical protein